MTRNPLIRFGLRPAALCLMLALSGGCIKMPPVNNPEDPDKPDPPVPPPPVEEYIYPFAAENQHVTAEITLSLADGVDLSTLQVEIPPLKYNKTLLVLMTQDDCKHAAYSTTWAAINGRPLNDKYFYNSPQLRAGDLPPDCYTLGKTLGSTDGTGREVRFSFATTLSPEWTEYMEATVDVKPGFTANWYRFFMKSTLVWSNVVEMANYGVGMAFHNVRVDKGSENDPAAILEHYGISQQIILKHLAGRGCKFLAEPDGNKNYLTAAASYDPIQSIVLQSSDGLVLCPWTAGDLLNVPVKRDFWDPPTKIPAQIELLMAKPVEERPALSLGVHGTDRSWAQWLLWLNDTYGKDGSDCVWMPSPEEYFEYNYLRHHATISKRVEGGKLRLTVQLPGRLYFYYPALTLNLRGLTAAQCTGIEAGETVTGMSYGDHQGELMINIDCRHALASHAEHYVKVYEATRAEADRIDAGYFVGMLKDSPRKKSLLDRIK